MFIKRPDAELHVLSFGRAPVSVLAVGGWAASGEIWLDLFGQLPSLRCVAMDHRGTGATAQRRPITLEEMADDLLAVSEALDLKSCILAAESSGAAVVLRAVQKAPDRFMGQVLVGANWQRPVPGSRDSFIAALRQDYPATLRHFIDRCLPETRSPELRRWGLQMLLRTDVADAIQLIHTQNEAPDEVTLPNVDLPTLLLHGTQDQIVPIAASRQLSKRLPKCELHELAGLGHVPIVTAPCELASRIDAFVQRLVAQCSDDKI